MLDDEREIRQIVAAQVDGWNRGDATGFAEGCRDDVDFTNILGMRWNTRDAFVRRHAEMFRGVFAGSRLVVAIERLSFPAPDVALAALATTLSGAHRTLPGMQPSADGLLRT
ncbi:MAG: SgcJ/EcaC family oxidoreductase, partial [Gemmatimonadales bacterium]